MKIVISNIRMFGETYSDYSSLKDYLNNQFQKVNVKVNINADSKIGITITQTDKKLFLSSKLNKIPLKPGDARIKELGRNYLESTRVTEKQFNAILDLLTTGLDTIGVSCLIRYYEFDNDNNSFIDLRTDMCDSMDGWMKIRPTSFPMENV